MEIKLFTRYLPIEGEVQIGDITLWDSDEGYYAGKFVEVSESFVIHAQAMKWKRYKLHLISTDIKVGDSVTQDGITFQEVRESHRDVISSLPTFFKVIGEISKEAIWLKNKMEINEEDVCKRYELEVYYAKREEQFYNKVVELPIDRKIKLEDRLHYNETIIHESLVFKCPTCKIFH